jgi:hypothetical protein
MDHIGCYCFRHFFHFSFCFLFKKKKAKKGQSWVQVGQNSWGGIIPLLEIAIAS